MSDDNRPAHRAASGVTSRTSVDDPAVVRAGNPRFLTPIVRLLQMTARDFVFMAAVRKEPRGCRLRSPAKRGPGHEEWSLMLATLDK
jgi:hypothetical protein